jgi:ATP-dependent DNA helicase RecG
MGNTRGGHILVGIDDKGTVAGVIPKEEEKIVSYIQGLIPPPEVSINKVYLNSKIILVIKVNKSARFVSLGSIAYIRVGRSNRPLDVEEMAIRSVEELKVSFDALPSPASKESVNREFFEDFLEKRRRIRGIPIRGSSEENLQRLKVVKEKRLTIAGLLFFVDYPQEYLSNVGARVIRLTPGMETQEILELTGPVPRLIDIAYQEVLHRVKKTEFRRGARRETIFAYPEEAIREAIINAFAHRNYRINADVRMFFKDNTFIVRNPGSFPAGVDPQNPEHVPRNPLICQFLYDMGYIERYGYGLIRMREAVDRHPLAEMEILTGGMKTEIIFEFSNLELDEIERKIILLMENNEISSGELSKMLNLSKTTVLKRLKRLEGGGLIKSKGKGRNKRYFS